MYMYCRILLVWATIFALEVLSNPAVATDSFPHNRLIPHKGESGDAPENTMASFRLAVERGFGFELDVALSKDGRVFTFHDANFSRVTGGVCTNRPAELTWDEISRINVATDERWKKTPFANEKPVLLENALALAQDGRFIYVDTPGPEIVPHIKNVLDAQHIATPSNVLFISSNKDTCRTLKNELPEFKVFWITSGRHWEKTGFPPVTADEMLAVLHETGADGVDCHYDPGVVTEESVATIHASGYEFHVWTINDLDAAAEAFRRGADTVTTDYADRLCHGLAASVGKSFTFATWNIGHYSCGRTYPSDIPQSEMVTRIARYSDFLDRADASIIGVCEDSWYCDSASTMTARATIFPRYSGVANEQMRPFDYNSLYWNGAECIETGRVVFAQAADTRFYRWGRFRICGRNVIVVEVHLDWNVTVPGHWNDRRLQIRKLIEEFKNEPCVVIGGDFNTSLMLDDGKTEVNTPEDYEPFRSAGYVAAHWGTIATWPASNPVLTIDNVFAKGLDIDQVELLVDPVLSDHALLRCRLSFPKLSRRSETSVCVDKSLTKRGVMSPGGDMTEDDFRTLASWGATLLRFQMVRDWHAVNGNRDLAEYDRWLDGRLDHFDKIILPLALKYGLRVVLDLHVPPGGRDANAEATMFYDAKYADHFVNSWRRIARRFRGRYGVYGYDLINEPCHKRKAIENCDYWNIQRRAAEAVRKEDPDVTIIIESNEWDAPASFADLKPMPFNNVIYQVHMYEPFAFTHQRVLGTRPWTLPWPCMEKGWGESFLRSILKPVRDFQIKYGARIYVGEFSAVCWAPGAENWLHDCIDIFYEYGWDWTYHAFREWPGWSVEHEDANFGKGPEVFRLAKDNPRKQILLNGLRRKMGE